MSKALLMDLTGCIGCRACQAACKQWNGLPAESTHNLGSYENPPRRSAKTWTTVTFNEVDDCDGFKWVFAKRQCMHCEYPACASACIVGALNKTAHGPVAYDAGKCIGCRYCMLACPFGVPTFEWDKPIPYIRKCTMCDDRQAEGKKPACAAACPTGVIAFGEREELLQEAHSRIRANPGIYVNHIYGEKEAGGTSELYLSSVPFENLDFPSLGSERTSRYADIAMLGVPPTIVAVGAAMGGIYWFVKHRERLMNLEDETSSKEAAEIKDQQDDG
jgi:formate dehydrogenase iron-sulfur subunit